MCVNLPETTPSTTLVYAKDPLARRAGLVSNEGERFGAESLL